MTSCKFEEKRATNPKFVAKVDPRSTFHNNFLRPALLNSACMLHACCMNAACMQSCLHACMHVCGTLCMHADSPCMHAKRFCMHATGSCMHARMHAVPVTARVKNTCTVESLFLEPLVSQTSQYSEPNLVCLGFASLKIYNLTPDFWNPHFLETCDNLNQFWLPWEASHKSVISLKVTMTVSHYR